MQHPKGAPATQDRTLSRLIGDGVRETHLWGWVPLWKDYWWALRKKRAEIFITLSRLKAGYSLVALLRDVRHGGQPCFSTQPQPITAVEITISRTPLKFPFMATTDLQWPLSSVSAIPLANKQILWSRDCFPTMFIYVYAFYELQHY